MAYVPKRRKTRPPSEWAIVIASCLVLPITVYMLVSRPTVDYAFRPEDIIRFGSAPEYVLISVKNSGGIDVYVQIVVEASTGVAVSNGSEVYLKSASLLFFLNKGEKDFAALPFKIKLEQQVGSFTLKLSVQRYSYPSLTGLLSFFAEMRPFIPAEVTYERIAERQYKLKAL